MISQEENTTLLILEEFQRYATSRDHRRMTSLLAQVEAEYNGHEGKDKDLWKTRLDGMQDIQRVYYAGEAALYIDYASQILNCLEGKPYTAGLVPEGFGTPEGRIHAYHETRLALDQLSIYAEQVPADQQPVLQTQITGLEERLTRLTEATPQ